MAEKKSKLCKLVDKDFHKDNLSDYKKLVDKAKYICKKCGRTANSSSNLCKSKKM